jgi:hypothetical protein
MNGGVATVLVDASNGNSSLVLALVFSSIFVAIGLLTLKSDALKNWIDKKLNKNKKDQN